MGIDMTAFSLQRAASQSRMPDATTQQAVTGVERAGNMTEGEALRGEQASEAAKRADFPIGHAND